MDSSRRHSAPLTWATTIASFAARTFPEISATHTLEKSRHAASTVSFTTVTATFEGAVRERKKGVFESRLAVLCALLRARWKVARSGFGGRMEGNERIVEL